MAGEAEHVAVFDVAEVEAAMKRGGPPTANDVTVMPDGRRLDDAESVRAVVAEFKARHTAGAVDRS